MRRVAAMIRRGRVKDAVARASELLLETPDDPHALSSLAHALMSNRQYYHASIFAFNAAYIAPDDISLWFLASRAKYASGDYMSAEHAAVEALRISDSTGDSYFDSSCWLLVAASLMQLGDINGALESLRYVPDSARVYLISDVPQSAG